MQWPLGLVRDAQQNDAFTRVCLLNRCCARGANLSVHTNALATCGPRAGCAGRRRLHACSLHDPATVGVVQRSTRREGCVRPCPSDTRRTEAVRRGWLHALGRERLRPDCNARDACSVCGERGHVLTQQEGLRSVCDGPPTPGSCVQGEHHACTCPGAHDDGVCFCVWLGGRGTRKMPPAGGRPSRWV